MESRWFLYAGLFMLGYFLLRFILANQYLSRQVAANLQTVVDDDKYKVKGRFD